MNVSHKNTNLPLDLERELSEIEVFWCEMWCSLRECNQLFKV